MSGLNVRFVWSNILLPNPSKMNIDSRSPFHFHNRSMIEEIFNPKCIFSLNLQPHYRKLYYSFQLIKFFHPTKFDSKCHKKAPSQLLAIILYYDKNYYQKSNKNGLFDFLVLFELDVNSLPYFIAYIVIFSAIFGL